MDCIVLVIKSSATKLSSRMAEPSSVAEQALKKVADQLTCAICLEDYKDPKLLQCFHVYCKECLEQLVLRDQQGLSLRCPSCRRSTLLPPSSVSGLQPAFHVHHWFEIRDALVKVTKVKGPQKTQCEKCSKNDATNFCRDCGQFICRTCSKIHQTWTELSTHEVISLDQLEGDVTQLVPPTKKVTYCSKHPTKESDLYCETCEELVCRDCIVRVHRDHQYDLITDAYPKHKNVITDHLQPVKQQLGVMNEAIESLDTRRQQISDQRMTIEANIHKTIRRLQEALEERKTKLIGELDQLTQHKMKSLAAQRDEFELVQTRLSSCLDFVSESLRTGSQAEILAAKKPVVQQIEEMTAEFKPELLVPAEQADLKFAANAELTLACSHFGKVYAHPVSPDKCHATGKGLEVARVGEQATATVHAVNAEGQECEEPLVDIACELVSCRDATSVKCSVKKREGNQYEVCYRPTGRGRHQLHIKVESQHIRGSPFAVFAIRKLGTPIRTIGGLASPCGVAVDGKGQIIVVEFNGYRVSIFSASGEKIRTFGVRGSAPGQFTNPRGVAIDCDGNLLVGDGLCVQKFSPQGDFLMSVGTRGSKPLQFSLAMDISIDPKNKRIYVCDFNNHRVQILNTDFSCFGSLGSGNRQFRWPCGVTTHSSGCVYVADFGNDCVKVFTEEGQFLRKIGKKGKGDGKLSSPGHVAIDFDDTVYVAEEDNHRVSMFTCQGQFLGSFGSHGTAPGQFNEPHGIAVDRDGLVYVSDCLNNRVQIF